MKHLRLALRLLWREGRSGELTILLLALIIAVSSSTAISLFTDRLHRTMSVQAAEFLAADMVIASPALLSENWHAKARELNLEQAQTAEFSSVLMENGEMLLAGIKAASERYPLRGRLKITPSDYSQEKTTRQPPKQGEAWVQQRILSALKLKLGDSLTVGEKALTVTHILTYEPDKRGDFYSMSPRVLINAKDLSATKVIQPGSHVHYFFQFNGSKDRLAAFRKWTKPQLNPSQRLMDIHEDRPEMGNTLKRAERYLGLSSIIVTLIAGVAIAMATRRYSERHFNTSAILRCLGCKQNEIVWLYGHQFLFLGSFGSLTGCTLGWLGQQGLFYLLRDLLPAEVADPSLLAIALGFLTGLAILCAFALPPLLRLKNVSALRVLRRELEPLPNSAWFIYGCALALITLLLWAYTHDLKMTATLLGGGVAALSLTGGLIYWLLRQIPASFLKTGLSWRFAVKGLLRTPKATVSQILAFSMTLMTMILSFSISKDLIADWQQQLPDNAPNHFALNIFPDQLDGFRQDLQEENIDLSHLYPIIKGRLVEINDTPVQQVVSKESRGERATHRDLSLTFSKSLPETNQISKGQWWETENSKPGLVSVESKLAKSLNVKIGDKLTFTIGSQQFHARINSFRKVKWETMKPNFYMIFSPGTLDDYPRTYLTSFHLPKARKDSLNRLLKKYPAMTLLEVDALLAQFKTILAQITRAIDYILYFALLAGFTVLFAAVHATLDIRIYEGALMRTLGANRRLLQNSHLIEFSLLGFISSLFALVIAETLIFALYHFVLQLDYQPHYRLWLFVPIAGTGCVTLAGFFGVRKVVQQPPMGILRMTEDR